MVCAKCADETVSQEQANEKLSTKGDFSKKFMKRFRDGEESTEPREIWLRVVDLGRTSCDRNLTIEAKNRQ